VTSDVTTASENPHMGDPDSPRLFSYGPPPPPGPTTGERIWTLTKGTSRTDCDLRTDTVAGVEVQLLRDGELYLGKRFAGRVEASRMLIGSLGPIIAPTKIAVSGQQSSVGRVEAPASHSRGQPGFPASQSSTAHRPMTDHSSQWPQVMAERISMVVAHAVGFRQGSYKLNLCG
jgi:hypothetical protein